MKLISALKQLVARPIVLAVLSLSILWAIFFWRLITPSAADRVTFIGGDFYSYYYATASMQSERLWAGQLPLWNPYDAAGLPLGASLENGTWYPLRWLSILLAGPGQFSPQWMQLEVAARYWLTSLMAWLFFRNATSKPLAALAGSILFTYGGYMTGYAMPQVSILDSAMWLPLALWGAHLASEKSTAALAPSLTGAIVAGGTLGVSLLAGHPQTTLLCLYLTLSYFVVRARQQDVGWVRIAGSTFVIITVLIGVSAITLLPAAELTRLATRLTQYGFEEKGVGYSLTNLLQVIWPGVFVGFWSPLYPGVGALILSIGAMVRPRRKEVVYWAVVLLTGLLLTLGANTALFDALYLTVPGFGLFRQQERAGVIVAMAFSALAAIQLDQLLKKDGENDVMEDRERRVFQRISTTHLLATLLAAMLLGAGAIGLGTAAEPMANMFVFVALMSTLFALWLAFSQQSKRDLAKWALIPVLALDLFTVGMNTANFVPDIPENSVYNVRPPRLRAPASIAWHVDGSGGVLGYGPYFRIPDIYPGGASILELDSMSKLRQIPVDRFWEVLSVRYATLLDGTPLPETTGLSLLATNLNRLGQTYHVFELQDPRPFAWLVYDTVDAQGSVDFAREIMADPRVDLRETAVTLYPLPTALLGSRPPDAQVTDFHMVTPERLTMRVTTSTDALLTVAIPNYPGWQARVNQQPVDVVNVYAGLIGVPVPSGENQLVVVEFVPLIQIMGATISLVTIIVSIIVIFIALRRDGRLHG